jgi:predicted permease
LRTTLLTAQVTATLVLLTAAGLFVLSFVRLTRAPLGFDPRDRVVLRFSLPAATYDTDAARIAFGDRWLAETQSVAGVRQAAIASESPLTPRGVPGAMLAVPGRPRPAPGGGPIALFYAVSPNYFAALDIAIVDGRAFDAKDVAGGARVAIVNQRFAQRMFPDQRAVGRTVELIRRFEADTVTRPGLVTIVGVVANVVNFNVHEVEYSSVYVPFAQAPTRAMDVVVRSGIPAAHVMEPLRRAARRVDPGLPISSAALGTERLAESLRGARFNLILVSVLAGLAVALAGVGIYGSMACAVEERAREFGVRMALGATAHGILAEALRSSIRVGAIGCSLGMAVVLAISRVIGDALYLVPGQHGGMLYRVATTNPLAIGAACALVLTVAVFAGLIPARRATRTDPLLVLRQDY